MSTVTAAPAMQVVRSGPREPAFVQVARDAAREIAFAPTLLAVLDDETDIARAA